MPTEFRELEILRARLYQCANTNRPDRRWATCAKQERSPPPWSLEPEERHRGLAFLLARGYEGYHPHVDDSYLTVKAMPTTVSSIAPGRLVVNPSAPTTALTPCQSTNSPPSGFAGNGNGSSQTISPTNNTQNALSDTQIGGTPRISRGSLRRVLRPARPSPRRD